MKWCIITVWNITSRFWKCRKSTQIIKYQMLNNTFWRGCRSILKPLSEIFGHSGSLRWSFCSQKKVPRLFPPGSSAAGGLQGSWNCRRISTTSWWQKCIASSSGVLPHLWPGRQRWSPRPDHLRVPGNVRSPVFRYRVHSASIQEEAHGPHVSCKQQRHKGYEATAASELRVVTEGQGRGFNAVNAVWDVLPSAAATWRAVLES